MPPTNSNFESDTDRQEIWRSVMLDRTTADLTTEKPAAGFTTTVDLDRLASGHGSNIPEPRLHMISGIPILARCNRRPLRAEKQAGWEAEPDHEGKAANRAMHRTTMPAALSARRLRSRLWCRKQVVVGDGGR